MRNLFFLCAFLAMGTTLWAQESDKTLVKTLNPDEAPNVHINIRNEGMESNPWDEGTIRVQLEIEANVPEAILAQLVKAGRYSLDGGKDGEVYIVSAPNLDKTITIGGKDLEEKIKITVQTPGYFALSDQGMLSKEINAEVIAARSNNAADAAKMLKKMKSIQEDVDIEVLVKSTSKYKKAIDLSTFTIVVDGEEMTVDQLKF
ncbi:MAG: hypothetical protein ACRBFS_07775 [Aureispira sp.]